MVRECRRFLQVPHVIRINRRFYGSLIIAVGQGQEIIILVISPSCRATDPVGAGDFTVAGVKRASVVLSLGVGTGDDVVIVIVSGGRDVALGVGATGTAVAGIVDAI